MNMGLVVITTQIDDVKDGVLKRPLPPLSKRDKREQQTIWETLINQFLRCVINTGLVATSTQIDDIGDGASKRLLLHLLVDDQYYKFID